MLITLAGLLDDGPPGSGFLPFNPRQTIEFPQGASVTLRVSLVQASNGAVVTIPANALQFTVSKAPGSDNPIKKTFPAAAGVQAELELLPADTKKLDPGRWTYDLWYTDASGKRNAIIPLSPLLVGFSNS